MLGRLQGNEARIPMANGRGNMGDTNRNLKVFFSTSMRYDAERLVSWAAIQSGAAHRVNWQEISHNCARKKRSANS